jgi:anti-anti-sigma factor
MTLKIERVVQPGVTVLKLSGRIDAEHAEELRELLKEAADGHERAIDLEEVKLTDRDAIKFLAACEVNGIKLQNCPAYIRNWIQIEKGQD